MIKIDDDNNDINEIRREFGFEVGSLRFFLMIKNDANDNNDINQINDIGNIDGIDNNAKDDSDSDINKNTIDHIKTLMKIMKRV